jgi:hypothetical protein
MRACVLDPIRRVNDIHWAHPRGIIAFHSDCMISALNIIMDEHACFRATESVWTSAMFLIILRIDRCAVAN